MADSKTVRVILEASVTQYISAMRVATGSTSEFSRKAIRAAQQTVSAYNSLATGAGLGLTAFGGALAFGLGQAVDAAIDFEDQFAAVAKTVGGSEAELAGLSDGIREMATRIPVATEELNRIAAAAGAVGVARGDILGFTETVAKLGVATDDLETDEATMQLARFMNVMGTAPGEVGNLAAALVDLGNKGASTEGEILAIAQRLAGTASVVKMTEQDTLGLANAMASVGLEVESGATAASRTLAEMAKAAAEGGTELERFASVAGLNAEAFARMVQNNPAEAFYRLVRGLDAANQAGENIYGILEALGITETRQIRAVLTLAAGHDTLRQSFDNSNQAFEEGTALNEEAARRFETTASQIQLMRNQLNEAAIAWGEILLPAVRTATEFIGNFAKGIADLPGPVRAVAVGLTLVATAVSLVAGATLLLLPRITATKTALAQAGIQAGLFRGSMQLMGSSLKTVLGSLSPWGIAITAATVGLGIWAQKNAEAKGRVDQLTAAIEADTGALGENTRAAIVNRLQSEGVLDMARELGISFELVADAAMGVPGALAQVASEAESAREAMGRADLQIESALVGVNEELLVAKDAAQAKAAAMGEDATASEQAAGANRNAAGATGQLEGALEGVMPPLEDTATLAERLVDALQGLGRIDLEQAALAWGDALADIREQLKGTNDGLDTMTQNGRDNRRAIAEAADAAIRHAEAMAEEGASAEKVRRTLLGHIAQLKQTAIEAGVSKAAISDYIRELGLTPKDIRTAVNALVKEARQDIRDTKRDMEDLDGASANPKVDVVNAPALAAIRGVETALDNIQDETVRVLIQTVREGRGYVPSVPHSGGDPFRSRATRSGGTRGDERVAVFQRGEALVSRADYQRVRAMLDARPVPVTSSVAPSNIEYGDTYHVNVTVNPAPGSSRRDAERFARDLEDALGRRLLRRVG